MAEQGSNDIITVVLTADNHLGYSALSSYGQHPRKREERQQRLRRAFKQATDFAVGQGVDLFIQAGDLFDTPHPAEQDRSFVATCLAQLRQAGVRTFALSGVHDTPIDTESYVEQEDQLEYSLAPQISYARLGALHYFPSPIIAPSIELEPVIVDIHGVLLAVCGLGVPGGQEGDPLAKVHVRSEVERAAISLLILHAPIEGLISHEHDLRDSSSMVARPTIAGQSSFHYILAGYHHGYHRMRIGNTDVIVAGATQHIDFDDLSEDPGFVFLGLATDGIRWCNHITVDALRLRRLVIHTVDLWPRGVDSTGTTRQTPTNTILEQLRPLCAADSIVQLRLVGPLSRDQYHQLDFNQIRQYGEEHCFELALDESGLSLLLLDLQPAEASRREVSFASEPGAPSANGHSLPASSSETVFTQRDVSTNLSLLSPPLESHQVTAPILESHQTNEAARSGGTSEERLSPREELVDLADEWMAAADDEQEKKALLATKEELLAALDKIKWH